MDSYSMIFYMGNADYIAVGVCYCQANGNRCNEKRPLNCIYCLWFGYYFFMPTTL